MSNKMDKMRSNVLYNRYMRLAVLLINCVLYIACSGEIVTDEFCFERVDVARMGLHYGTDRPSSMEFDQEQSDAIAALVVHGLVNEQLCSAVMVEEEWFLTVSHCYQMIDPSDKVYLFFGNEISHPTAIREIVETVEHPTLGLLLLRTGKTVLGSTNAVPFALNQESIESEYICRHVTASGFGVTESGDRGKRLFVSELIVDFDEEYITINGFGNKGACIGDSGGPLLIRNGKKDGTKLIGVLQTGQSNCVGVDLFVRVDICREWIVKTTEGK